MDYSTLNETQTRYNLIDPMLVKAGWNLSDRSQIWFEVPVQGYDASPQSGITNYCMFRSNGEVLAVVEVKRTRRDERVGKEQALQSVSEVTNAVEKLFSENEIVEVIELTKKLAA